MHRRLWTGLLAEVDGGAAAEFAFRGGTDRRPSVANRAVTAAACADRALTTSQPTAPLDDQLADGDGRQHPDQEPQQVDDHRQEVWCVLGARVPQA